MGRGSCWDAEVEGGAEVPARMNSGANVCGVKRRAEDGKG